MKKNCLGSALWGGAVKACAMMVCAVCVSCQSIPDLEEDSSTTDNAEQSDSRQMRDVQFVMKGISIDYVSSRATISSEGMTDLYVWEGTELLKHQVSTDADFGTPTISLTVGAHDLTFVASKATGQSWADGVWSCTKVADTYGTVLSYTVSSSSSSKQVQLSRVNGRVQWTVEDAIPTAVSTVSISIPQCYGLDAGLNGVNASTYEVKDHAVSTHDAGYCIGTMILPADHANGSTISPTITFSNGVTYTTECTIKPNVITNIHGQFFSGSGAAEVSLITDWGVQNDVSVR